MYKAIVLVATLCASMVAATYEDVAIGTRFARAVASSEALRQKHQINSYRPYKLG